MNGDISTVVYSGILGAISFFSLLRLFRMARLHSLNVATRRLKLNPANRSFGSTDVISQSSSVGKKRTGRVTISKLLRYARWSITLWVFHLIGVAISCLILCVVAPYTNMVTHI